MELGGTRWVVTGASAGMGEAIAAELRGAEVIGIARRDTVAVRADLSDPAQVEGSSIGSMPTSVPSTSGCLTSAPQRVVELLTVRGGR